MAKAFVFYNPLAGRGRVLEDLEALEFVLDAACVFCDMTKPETYGEDLFAMSPEDALVICGGDGTLHRFVNFLDEIRLENEMYYYPAGEHNDFARDFGCHDGSNPFAVTKALRDLPVMGLGSRSVRFLTGVCCLAGPGMTAPQQVKVSADRALYAFDKVRFTAVMQGKHCSGGMIPDAGRQRTDKELSCVLIHGCSRLTGKRLLRQLRKGHTPRSRHLTVLTCRELCLTFEGQVCLLADGETYMGSGKITFLGKESK